MGDSAFYKKLKIEMRVLLDYFHSSFPNSAEIQNNSLLFSKNISSRLWWLSGNCSVVWPNLSRFIGRVWNRIGKWSSWCVLELVPCNWISWFGIWRVIRSNQRSLLQISWCFKRWAFIGLNCILDIEKKRDIKIPFFRDRHTILLNDLCWNLFLFIGFPIAKIHN